MEYNQHIFDKFKGVTIYIGHYRTGWVAYATEDIPGNHPNHHVIFNDLCDGIERPTQYAALSAAQWYVKNYYHGTERRRLFIARANKMFRGLNKAAVSAAISASYTKEALNRIGK